MSKVDVVNEIHKNALRNFPRRHVILKDIDDLWQADLIDMKSHSKVNKNYKYILVVIDAFSKYAWAYPLKSKNKQSVCDSFQKLLQKGRIPKNLQTDLGTEFYNTDFKKLLLKYSINHYSTYTVKKASIVERLIRTLKSKIYKQFSLQGNYKWNNEILDDILKEYNSSFHRTIKCPPNKVNEKNKKIILNIYRTMQLSSPSKKYKKLKEGDYVRISKYKGEFEKGYTPNWSTEIFQVNVVQNTSPVTYLLKDFRQRPILGAFYIQELQKTKHPNIYLIERILRKKRDRLFVKWLGLPPSENSWINETSVV